MAIEGKDLEDLKQAVVRLEFPSFISKMTSFVEKPVGRNSVFWGNKIRAKHERSYNSNCKSTCRQSGTGKGK